MDFRYKHLLSPIRIGKYIVKNRLEATNALPHFINGPETWPGPDMITYYGDLAKNGPGIVSFMPHYGEQSQRGIPVADICRFPIYDAKDPSVDNYVSQIAEVIRFYGAIPAAGHRPMEFPGYDVVTGDLTWDQHPEPEHCLEIPEEMLLETVEDTRTWARRHWANGFRMMTMPMGYECSMSSRFLSGRLNTRTDEYGGSLENRARYPLMHAKAIKEVCPDMLVEIILSGEMPGLSTEEVCQLAKMAEDYVDIIQIRQATCKGSHPTGFNSEKGTYKTIEYAQAIKESGAKVIVAPVGGFQNPDDMERLLREGRTDMFAIGRAFICDYDYMQKIREERPEDIIPCVRCNKCHVNSMQGPFINVCSVNPEHGLKARLSHMVEPTPAKEKHVAVIGGGPAGMQAALTAARRGHTVTLFEKRGELGGQLRHADFISFKWPLADYRHWLARQVEKSGVDIRLNTCPTPEELEQMGFDAVIAALGAEPKVLHIPGIDGKNVWNPLQVFGHEDELPHHLVVVGCAETGLETAIHLTERGHEVTALTRQSVIAPDCDRVHYREYVVEKWESLSEHLHFVLEATTEEITPEGVVYRDKAGERHFIPAQGVVVSGGMVANADAAAAYYGCAKEFITVGDCFEVKNMQAALRSGYAAACTL